MHVKRMELVCLIEDKSPNDIWVIGIDKLALIKLGEKRKTHY